jgi:hypothetical protein
MASVEITRLARDDLDELIQSRNLPEDARARVSRSLLILHEFPRAGKALSGAWRDCRAVIGPWGWLIVVYLYDERKDRAVVIAFQDARTSGAATAGA